MMRKAGILLPLSALPSPYGIGALGRAAYDFVDFLAAAGQSLWQILPVNPTGFGDSPYQSCSAFAGSPYYIDLDMLCERGLLKRDEADGFWAHCAAQVDYGLLFERRFDVLARAAARQNKTDAAYLRFCGDNAHWLEDYALYMAIKEAQGYLGFQSWPVPLRLREHEALKAARAQYAKRVEMWRCLQFFFHTQWQALKSYANAQGVGIIGDIPIYVSDDSSDLWANPGLFLLDGAGRPACVAGVPPDAFSADGQLWGNPLYNWPAHRRGRYEWWLARLRQAGQLFDVTRIDHFRGFAGYYAVPAGSPTARNGQWVKGPGSDFVRAVHKALPGLQIIAEDLGYLTPDVKRLLKASRYPGMKVLQFAFNSREENDYLPHNYPHNTVVYTGTHDNNTTTAWAHTADENDTAFARHYLGIGSRQPLCPALVRAALASVANVAVIPLQDWMGLGEEARFNTPATQGGGNWRWRLLPGQLGHPLAASIRLATRMYGRLPDTEAEKARDADLPVYRMEKRAALPGQHHP